VTAATKPDEPGGQDGTDSSVAPPTRVPIRMLLPPDMPSLYATHVAVNSFTQDRGAWELTFRRVNVCYAIEGDPVPREAQASCVSRIVLSDQTMREMMLLLGRTVGQRIGLDVLPHPDGDVMDDGATR